MVEFDRIGPGQVARQVVQVIGKDGPIPNPKNIRYLAPDAIEKARSLQSAHGPANGLATSGLSLGVSAGVLALQAVTLVEVKKMNRKLDKVLSQMGVIDSKLDHITSRLRAIEAGVAQNNFRHALNHIVTNAWTGDGYDFETLSKVGDEISSFLESVEADFQPGELAGLRLNSDVREQLQNLWRFFYETRLLMYQVHNRAVASDPQRCAISHPIYDYIPSATDTRELRFLIRVALASEEVANTVWSKFTFSKREDCQQLQGIVEASFGEFSARNFVTVAMYGIWSDLVPEHLDANEAMARFDELEPDFQAYPSWWLTETDAGLLWRVLDEARAIETGYPSRFGHLMGDFMRTTTDGELEEGKEFDEVFVFDFDEVHETSAQPAAVEVGV